ncbi:MAG: exosortase H-associated membrane protein [Lysobacterales bacterium]
MSESAGQGSAADPPEERPELSAKGSSLKVFLLRAVLWLPLAFFFWILWRQLFVAPVTILVDGFLTGLWPEQFYAIIQIGHELEAQVLMAVPEEMARMGEGRPVLGLPVNPLIYGYGLPLFAGLVICTPLSHAVRALQILVGWLVIVLVQAWGSVWDIFQILHFQLGQSGGADVMAEIGVGASATALAYQFGYLILPSVVPVIAWMVLNRRYIESLVPQLRGLSRRR